MRPLAAPRRVTLLLATVVLLLPLTLWGDTGANHQVRVRPVRLGTSGGNLGDINDFFCCSGTLGALVRDGNGQYVLSNNHVLARTNLATAGEDITQPGLIDENPVCAVNPGDAVADLTRFVSIAFDDGIQDPVPTNTVDAAIAKVRPNLVDRNGTIIDVGVVSTATLDPAIGLAVKKSGRSTGLTTGTIDAVNVTVDVTYGTTCGAGDLTARFVNQIVSFTDGFSDAGDSGALIVENVSSSPRAVGLLFAGGIGITVANPIRPVLNSLNVTMVGNSPTTSLLGGLLGVVGGVVSVVPKLLASVVAAVTGVKVRHEAALFAVPGVVGVGVGVGSAAGQGAIQVYVKTDTADVRSAIPASLEGVEVMIIETGAIVAR